mgnify:CR=1 FL=1
MKKKLVLFDCDGTLLDTEIILARVFLSTWAERGVHMSLEDYTRLFVGTGHDAPVVRETWERMPPDTEALCHARCAEAFRTELRAVRGIPELLAKLGPEMETCVASNSSAPYLKNVLAMTKLDAFFGDRVYSAHVVGRAKPAPDLFRHAAQNLGYAPDRCLVVEDSPAGIRAARAAGMRVIAFVAGGHCRPSVVERLRGEGPDGLVEDAEQLARLIEAF